MSSRTASVRPSPGCRPTCANGPEGGLGGVFGLVRDGEIPQNLVGPLISTAKQSFVDGLGLATTVSAVVVAIAAVLVYRFLPSDRNRPQVAADGAPAGSGDSAPELVTAD